MKSKLVFFFAVMLSATLLSCSDDDEKKAKGDPDLTHTGEQWTISSATYMLIDQGTSGAIGQSFKSGTKQNAGTFYFVDGVDTGNKGSFEMTIEGYNKEDAFSFTFDNGDISVVDVEQSAGTQTNQNVLVLNGTRTSDTEMTLDGSIVKQSTTGQFLMEVEMVLTKK